MADLLQRLCKLPTEILILIFTYLDTPWLKYLRSVDRKVGSVATEVLFSHNWVELLPVRVRSAFLHPLNEPPMCMQDSS